MPTKDTTAKFQFPHAQTHQRLCFPGAEFCVSYFRWAKVVPPMVETGFCFERWWTELVGCVLLKFCCLEETQLSSFSSSRRSSTVLRRQIEGKSGEKQGARQPFWNWFGDATTAEGSQRKELILPAQPTQSTAIIDILAFPSVHTKSMNFLGVGKAGLTATLLLLAAC